MKQRKQKQCKTELYVLIMNWQHLKLFHVNVKLLTDSPKLKKVKPA